MTEDLSSRIRDETDTRSFFAQIPHIVRRLGLDVYARDLYWYYVAEAGLNGGVCSRSTRQIAKETDISVGKITQSKRALKECGLIYVDQPGNATMLADNVIIPDIWDLARYLFKGKDRPRPQRLELIKQKLIERARSWDEQGGVHLIEQNHEEHDSTTNVDAGAARVDMFGSPVAEASPGKRDRKPKEPKADKPLAFSTRMKKAFLTPVESRGWIANTGGPEQIKAVIGELLQDSGLDLHGNDEAAEERLLEEIGRATEQLMAAVFRPNPTQTPVMRFDRVPSAVRSLRAGQQKQAQAPISQLEHDQIDLGGFFDNEPTTNS